MRSYNVEIYILKNSQGFLKILRLESNGNGIMPCTVDSGYSHTKCFQEKCDYKRSVTLSGVTQINFIDTRKLIFIA